MANEQEEQGGGNDWLDACRIVSEQSSIRLVYAFQADAKTLQLVRLACAARPDRWRDATKSVLSEGALTGPAAELVEQHAGSQPLTVIELAPAPRGKADAIWPSKSSWTIHRGGQQRRIELAFSQPQVWLFDIGIGQVVFELKGMGEDARAWLEVLHHFRLLKWRKAAGTLDHSTAPGTPQAGLDGLLRSFLDSLLPDRPQWWAPADMKQQLRSFATLYVARGRIHPAPPDFQRRLLYQVCELAPPGREFALPDDKEEDHLRGAHYCYSKGAHFVASREGCTFVAVDADLERPFWSSTMPDHLRRLYFVTYLLTQYQRQAIELLRSKVAKAGRDLDISADEWHEIRKLSATVKSHGYFVEVAQSNNHARFERMVRDLAQVDRLFELTTRSVDEVTSLKLEEHERVKAEAQRRHERELASKQRKWTIGGAAVAFASLLLTTLNVNIVGITDGEGMQLEDVIFWALLFAAIGLLLGDTLAPRNEARDESG